MTLHVDRMRDLSHLGHCSCQVLPMPMELAFLKPAHMLFRVSPAQAVIYT